jgi:hypothetical protein
VRSKFDKISKNLPQLKTNPIAPETTSKVVAWLDSTYSKSTKDGSTIRAPSRSSGENPYPKYFYQETCQNIFKPIPLTKESPSAVRAFHLTQPEHRIQDAYFNSNVTVNYEDSIMSTTKIMLEHGSYIDSVHQDPSFQTFVASKDINGKILMAKTITDFEIDRVKKHKRIRER